MARRLKTVAEVLISNVDKKSSDGELAVSLCNYTDVYYNPRITANLQFMEATATADQVQKFRLCQGDVLVTKDSETAEDIAVPALVVEDLPGVLCGYHLALVRTDPLLADGRYLYWALASTPSRQHCSVAATGVTRYGLRADSLGNLMVPLPDLTRQRTIADFLDRETARMNLLIATEQRLASLALERLEATIHGMVLPGDLDTLPARWELRRNKTFLREVVQLSSSGQEELLTVSHLTGVSRRSEKDVTMFLAESNEGYKLVLPGDLVINTMWAWMGALGISPNEGIVSPAYGVYRFTDAGADPRYFDALFRDRRYIVEMTRFSKGVWTSRLRLYPEAFLALFSPYPPPAQQKLIADRIRSLVDEYDRIGRLMAKSVGLLRERRQALITAAVTGQLDIYTAAA